MPSLVGSEMCIRDSTIHRPSFGVGPENRGRSQRMSMGSKINLVKQHTLVYHNQVSTYVVVHNLRHSRQTLAHAVFRFSRRHTKKTDMYRSLLTPGSFSLSLKKVSTCVSPQTAHKCSQNTQQPVQAYVYVSYERTYVSRTTSMPAAHIFSCASAHPHVLLC